MHSSVLQGNKPKASDQLGTRVVGCTIEIHWSNGATLSPLLWLQKPKGVDRGGYTISC